MCNDNGDNFIAAFQKVLLAPYLCDWLFSVFMLMNLGHTCLFKNGFFTVYFGYTKKMWLLQHILHRGNIRFWGKQSKCLSQRN